MMILINDVLVLTNYDNCLLGASRQELERHNLRFKKMRNINDMLKEVQSRDYLLIILEMTGQNVDCIQNLVILLRDMVTTPIVVVSKENIDVNTKVTMLNSGVDQVFSLPMTTEEAIASIFALIRRYTKLSKPTNPDMIFYSHGILINCDHYKVNICGKDIFLTLKEFDILSLLVKNHNKVLTHEYIVREVWGEEYVSNSKDMLWVQIVRLRSKIQFSSDLPNYIRTVHGIGYSFDPQPISINKSKMRVNK